MYDTDRIYTLMFHTKSNPKVVRFDCIHHKGYNGAVSKLKECLARSGITEEPIIDEWKSEDIV